MRIAVNTQAIAVRRTLELLVSASGHVLAADAEAELIIEDCIHPQATQATAEKILLGGTSAQAIALPVRADQLVKQLQSRALQATDHRLSLGEWRFDTMTRNLSHPESISVALTEKEALLLKSLRSHYPQAAARDVLLRDVWGIAADIDTHTLETHMYRLRSKLGSLTPSPCDIVTEDGAYRLVGAGD